MKNQEIIQSYPLFKANQVLRENQLNDIVKYLEQQDRISRICLMGTGIVCGLKASWDETINALYVSAGTGVTSEGYLVKSGDIALDGYRQIDLDLKWFGPGDDELAIDLENAPDPIAYELVKRTDGDDDLTVLTEGDLTEKVLVLVHESLIDEDQGLCGNDCDEKGKSRTFISRYILIDKVIADLILRATYDPEERQVGEIFENMEELFYHKFSAIHPVIERFGYKDDNTVKLNDIISYDIFIERYQLIIKTLSTSLDTVFNEVNKIFSPVFVPMLVTGAKLVEGTSLSQKIQEVLENEHYKLNIQYLHDYLCDMVHAYGELMEAVFDLVAECPPNTHRFPRFLMVRGFVNDEEHKHFSIYRTPYTQPPVYNGNKNRLSETITLYRRLETLINGDIFQVPDNKEDLQIRITPGKSDMYHLGERAVPFYYQNSNELITNWSSRLKRIGRTGKVYSYFRQENPPYNEPFTFRMEGCDFLRIEGHIGKSFYEVVSRLTDLRQRFNLSFEMVALKIGEEFDDDLFQFICEDLACERRKFEEQYSRLREVLIRHFSETNYHNLIREILPEELNKFDLTNFKEAYEEMRHGQTQEGLPTIATFEEIDRCYKVFTERWEKTKKKHLFHHFALEHPGMEHRGGVTIGGTFILAYNDWNESESRTIVADFYLPYSCISGCIPTTIIAERPRPVLLVSPSVFCEGDTNPTELQITLHPEGGVITGPGYSFEGKHFFTPSESGVNEGTVTLKYYIDGGEATYSLTIIKLPVVEFNILNANGEQVSEICQNGGQLRLSFSEGVPGGQFTVWNGEEELTEFLIEDDSGNHILDPMLFPVEIEEPLLLLVRYSVEGNLCGNELSQELTIIPVPEAEFTFEGEVNEVCLNNQDRLEILPNQGGGNFTAYIDNNGQIQGIIQQDEEGRWFINLSAVNLRSGQNVQLTIRHIIKTEQGCGNSAEQQLRIWSIQDVDFLLPDRVCQSDQPFSLNPQPGGGTFNYHIEEMEVENLIEDGQFFPNRIQSESSVMVSVKYSVNVGVCDGSIEKTIELLPVPQVDFEATLVNRSEIPNRRDGFLVSITNVQPSGAQNYNWRSNSESLAGILNRNYNQSLPEEPLGFNPDFEGELWLELSAQGEICLSEPVRKRVLPAMDSFSLFISIPELPETDPNNRIPLQEGAEIDFFRFRDQPFFLRATTTPNPADFVDMELVFEGDSVERKKVLKNADNNGFDLTKEGGFDPAAGKYMIRATPYMNSEDGSAELKGFTTELNFRIVRVIINREDNPGNSGRELTEEAITLLRRRDSAYRSELEELRADSALARTVSFQKSEAFLLAQSDSQAFEEQYFDLVDTLERAANRTESGSDRQGEFFKLMEITTKHFMDREIVKSPDNISEEIINGMVSKIERMEEVGFNRETLKNNWAGESLRSELNAPTAELFERALIPRWD